MQKQVIILNKPFIGKWTEKEGNIAHEVIDFFLDDNGEHYIYNLKSGTLPKNIDVGENAKNTHNIYCKYLVLTGPFNEKDKTVSIKYVIELEQALHSLSCPRKNTSLLKKNQNIVKTIIEDNDIKYCDNYLYDLETSYEDLYVTFKAKRIFKAYDGITFKSKMYRFQHNIGYLYSSKNEDDFNTLNNLINKCIENKTLKEIKLGYMTDTKYCEKIINNLIVDFPSSKEHIEDFLENANKKLQNI